MEGLRLRRRDVAEQILRGDGAIAVESDDPILVQLVEVGGVVDHALAQEAEPGEA